MALKRTCDNCGCPLSKMTHISKFVKVDGRQAVIRVEVVDNDADAMFERYMDICWPCLMKLMEE